MRDRNSWGRRYEREEDMGGTDWSGASGRGGMREGGYGGAWGGQREHSGYSNYAGGGDRDMRDMRDRQWGRDRDRYDRDEWRMGDHDRELGNRNDMDDYDDRPRNLGGRDYETRHFGGGRGGFAGQGGYGGSTSYGGYQGSFGMGDYGTRRGMGYGNIGRGDIGQGMPRGRGEGWGRQMGGSDLGFGYGEHEGDVEDRGPHYGKGPKGYRRSDDRIREDVCECIARQGHIDATEVEVKVENGVVTLSGTVGQRHDKRMLEQMVERIHGVDDVRNELRLQRSETSSQRTQHQNGDQNRQPQHPNGRTART